MNPLARFSAIINPQNLIMIVSLIIRCIMRLLVFQCSHVSFVNTVFTVVFRVSILEVDARIE